jgi:hypothetical protein
MLKHIIAAVISILSASAYAAQDTPKMQPAAQQDTSRIQTAVPQDVVTVTDWYKQDVFDPKQQQNRTSERCPNR